MRFYLGEEIEKRADTAKKSLGNHIEVLRLALVEIYDKIVVHGEAGDWYINELFSDVMRENKKMNNEEKNEIMPNASPVIYQIMLQILEGKFNMEDIVANIKFRNETVKFVFKIKQNSKLVDLSTKSFQQNMQNYQKKDHNHLFNSLIQKLLQGQQSKILPILSIDCAF